MCIRQISNCVLKLHIGKDFSHKWASYPSFDYQIIFCRKTFSGAQMTGVFKAIAQTDWLFGSTLIWPLFRAVTFCSIAPWMHQVGQQICTQIISSKDSGLQHLILTFQKQSKGWGNWGLSHKRMDTSWPQPFSFSLYYLPRQILAKKQHF